MERCEPSRSAFAATLTSGHMAQVARLVGALHTALEIELDAPSIAREILGHFDEPFGDSSAVPVLAMSRATRKEVKVVLSGDGGDEIFGGYGNHLRHLPMIVGHKPIRARPRQVWVRRIDRPGDRRSSPRAHADLPAPISKRLGGAGPAAAKKASMRPPTTKRKIRWCGVLLAMKIARAGRNEMLLAPLLGGQDISISRFEKTLLARMPRNLARCARRCGPIARSISPATS